MSMKKAYFAWALVLLLIVGLVGGCQRTEPEKPEVPGPADPPAVEDPVDEADYGGTMFLGVIGDATTFNPILVNDTASSLITQFTSTNMLYVDPTLAFIPVAAERWETSPDGLLWTFYLRDDVRWQDGQPWTAHDVEFTFLSILHPEYTGVRARDYDSLVGADEYLTELAALGRQRTDDEITEDEYYEKIHEAYEAWKAKGAVTVVDNYTIEFRLDKPHAPMLANMSMRIIPKHILKDHMGREMQNHEQSRKPVGSGPWQLKEWITAERIVVTASEDYFDGRPFIDEIVTVVIPDQNTLMIAVETGEIDAGNILPEEAGRFMEMPHINVVEFVDLSYTYFGFDLRNPLFQDLRVRQAIAHGVDRETIVAELYQGHGIVAHTHGSPARWDYNPDVTTYEFNPDKARQLLADAGWSDPGTGVLEKDGQQLAFRLMTNAGNKIRETAVVIIQDQLGDVGIEVEVQLIEWSTFVNNHLLAKEFDTIIVGWRLGTDPDAFTIWHSEGGPFNFVSYSNPRVDELLMKGRQELNPDQRKLYYAEMQEILAYELPYVFLFFPNAIYGVNKRIQGEITPHPHEFYWNVHRWFIPKELQ